MLVLAPVVEVPMPAVADRFIVVIDQLKPLNS